MRASWKFCKFVCFKESHQFLHVNSCKLLSCRSKASLKNTSFHSFEAVQKPPAPRASARPGPSPSAAAPGHRRAVDPARPPAAWRRRRWSSPPRPRGEAARGWPSRWFLVSWSEGGRKKTPGKSLRLGRSGVSRAVEQTRRRVARKHFSSRRKSECELSVKCSV